MKYTFMTEENVLKTVEVPNDFIERTIQSLRCDPAQACEIFLSDEGYIDNQQLKELNNKVAAKRKPRAPKKPDIDKRRIIDILFSAINECLDADATTIIHPEKAIQFTLGEHVYEVALSRKRKRL